MAELETLPLELDPVAWIEPHADGTFSYTDGDSGILAKQFQVIQDDQLIDVVAWAFNDPLHWWSLRGIATYLGGHELRAAWWQDRPAFLVRSPQAYLDRAGDCCVILDWDADLNAILGAVPSVICSTPDLASRLEQVWRDQAKPKIEIRVLGLEGTAA